MTFQPVVPLAGYTGWRFLQRTLEGQQAAFEASTTVVRATDYFRENIGEILKAEDLVADRRLLEVALGAFGLDDDINNKFFIQKILEDGTTADDALANRLADNRYAAFSQAFGFGDFGLPLTTAPTLAEDIVQKFEAKQFERAVGEQNNDLRLALNLETALDDIVSGSRSENAQWFSMMGNQPLRQVFQIALGLPPQIASIDLDQQLEVFQRRAAATFGTESLADFNDPDTQEDLIRLFLVRSEAASTSATSSGNIALSLLQSSTLVPLGA
ncbi:DUF1217 domain-containing protein [Yoonia sp. 208BN28-4]|uniref:DUF1217 domain-containing protein n=1 Tax=Yoonia sp. 208BN28-4 TaxID=3126505 RepID=UPI0030A3DCAE